MIVGIDSNVVVYAGLVPRVVSDAGNITEQKALSRRARILLHELRNDQVVLPTIAVAEILVPVPTSQHGQLIAALKEVFLCAEFGDRAATIAADLWSKYKKVPTDRRYDNRHTMLADVKIVAAAKAVGATVFYTNDESCQKLADIVMQGKGLPVSSTELFIDEMLAEGAEEKPNSQTKRRRPPRPKK